MTEPAALDSMRFDLKVGYWSQCTEYSVVNTFNINTQPFSAISRYPPCGDDSFLTNFFLSKLDEITITGLDPCHLGACILRKYRPIELSDKMEKHTPLPTFVSQFRRYIYSPVIVPGDDNGTIYIVEKMILQSYML